MVCSLLNDKQILPMLICDGQSSISEFIHPMYSTDADEVVEREKVEFQGHVVTTRRPVFSHAAHVGVNPF